jgi:hypothetical protein
MKFALKLIVIAVLSFSIGIACASPLLISELNIRPWITHVQGPTAELDVKVVYANFTVQNGDHPISEGAGPTISYYVVVNITNPSDFGATMLRVDFLAAQKIINNSASFLGDLGGSSWNAKGAWVDGIWYNLTRVDVGAPSFDENGSMYWVPMPSDQIYWMEGVQIFDKYVEGTLTNTYLNMNGTWVDVTGKIVVDRPKQESSSYSADSVIVNQIDAFENLASREYSSNGSAADPAFGAMQMKYYLVGEGYFDNYWAPHQSRLFVISGSWDVRTPFGSTENIAALQSGNIMLKTEVANFIVNESGFVNNTITDTSSFVTELKQIHLTRTENSYVYTTLPNAAFQIDKWGLEAFLKSGS